jgi:alpha-beta hydrolase superfamily lysophospholipase
METDKINFLNKQNLKLTGYLDFPKGKKPKAYSIFAHCFTCSKDLKAIANINRALTDFGIASLRFDFTGIGESEGDFSDSNYSGYLNDVLSAAEILNKNYEPPKLLIGHSLGGCAAIESASKIQSINAVAVIGTPAEPSNLSEKLKRTREKTAVQEIAETEIGGVKFKFRKQFFDDIEKHRLEPLIRNLGKPLLILHSPADTYTDIENAALIFKAAKHPKSFISLDDIDHLMLKKEDAEYAGRIIGVWFQKYL